MPTTVKLTIIQGSLRGQEFIFPERTTCILGRAGDCQPRLPQDEAHRTISRHHCLLDVNPPDIRIRDFGSLNGTYVNGRKIGQRDRQQTPEEAARIAFPEYDLKNGDEIQLGETVFRVGLVIPAVCGRCNVEIPEGRQIVVAGGLLCPTCHDLGETAPAPPPIRQGGKTCPRCGVDVAREVGPHRQGDYLCAACRADPLALAQRLLTSAAGEDQLLAIRGYRILRELGHGGMGAVFLAEREADGERVALKVMLPQVAADQWARDRFLREIDNTKVLRHPNVVQLREAGCWQGTFFFTLEYCDGGSVERRLKQAGGTLPVAEAVGIILQALEGLDYAHNVFEPGRGLVHRDLKPSNLLLAGTGPDRRAKVADYGLSKAFDQAGLSGQTRTGAMAGTPYFMPRQQVINFKYAKPEVDVWAMAASLYALLTGSPPRNFVHGTDPWQRVLQTDAMPIRQRQPALPPRLADVIDLALIDRPNMHFQSAAEFKRALENAV